MKKLDVLSNDILLDANEWGGHLAAMASKKWTDRTWCRTASQRVNTCSLFDPLDGSSNIDVNVRSAPSSRYSSVRRRRPEHPEAAEQAFMQPGTAQVAAGYAVSARPRCSC